jgi:ComF family protein
MPLHRLVPALDLLVSPLDLLAPPLCWACRAPAARASALCRECRGTLRFLGDRDEFLADSERNSSSPSEIGRRAHARPLRVRAWAAVAYEGAARELVKAFKFHGATAVAAEMAALMLAHAPPSLLAGALVPVPLHPVRQRTRGFNQAERLAAAVAARTGLPSADLLLRAGPATRQVGRNRSARLRAPPGSIRAAGPAPAKVVLIDDVVTTGATLAACAAALRAAGSDEVTALAFARTTGR